jgi:hypothetical protein
MLASSLKLRGRSAKNIAPARSSMPARDRVTGPAQVLGQVLRIRRDGRLHRARQIAVFTGSGIILVISWFSVPWLGASTIGQLIGVRFLWLALMLAFQIAFGRLVFRASRQRLAADFDFRKGGHGGIAGCAVADGQTAGTGLTTTSKLDLYGNAISPGRALPRGRVAQGHHDRHVGRADGAVRLRGRHFRSRRFIDGLSAFAVSTPRG